MTLTCKITFENNPTNVFYPGQLLCGHARLILGSEKSVRDVHVRIQGRSHASWREDDNNGNSDTWSGSEEHFNEKICLVNGSNGGVRMLPGVHNYEFKYMLPAKLPSSITFSNGYVKYEVHLVLDIIGWFNKKFKEPFTVLNVLNLNDDPLLREPVIVENEKTFLEDLFFTSKPLKMIARTRVGGFIPGQTIDLELNVNNRSNQRVSKFSVSLMRNITYHARYLWPEYSSRSSTIPITKQNIRGCGANQTENFRVNIQIPQIPPTEVTTCKIIQVEYLIRIIGLVKGFHINPVLDLPIVIGTYPMHENTSVSNTSTEEDPPAYSEALGKHLCKCGKNSSGKI